MIAHQQAAAREHRARRGLAPLELVLGLPMLIFLMALMINYATMACYKIRGLNVARQQMWSNRQDQDRNGVAPPTLSYWNIPGATKNNGGAGSLSDLDVSLSSQEVVRGPLSPAQVRGDLFDPAGVPITGTPVELIQGTAQLAPQSFPMLSGVLPQYQFKTQTYMLDDPWPFWGPSMTWWNPPPSPPAAAQNPATRSNVCAQNFSSCMHNQIVYNLPSSDVQDPQNIMNLANQLFSSSFQQALSPMTYDADDYTFRSHAELGWGGLPYFPNFNPAYPTCSLGNWDTGGSCQCDPGTCQYCNLDDTATRAYIENPGGLLDQIQGNPGPPLVWGVAKKMASAYYNMYQYVYTRAQTLLSTTPSPLSSSETAYLQGLVSQVQPIASALQQFNNSLSY
jgi:hypothetical protein